MIDSPSSGKVNINLKDTGYEDYYLTNDGNDRKPTPANALGIPYVMPLKLRRASTKEDWWLLPLEPLVTITGGNIVAKRIVAKGSGRGTIKERWTQDDYSVTIDGIFIYNDDDTVYPTEDVQKLRSICEAKEAVEVECDILQFFGINQIVIESYDFPFTKGNNAQRYSFTGFSDDITQLLLEEKDV